MFASKMARVDAFPWVSVGPGGNVLRRHRTMEEAQRLEARSAVYRYDYRPREHVQHNEPNPILVEFRLTFGLTKGSRAVSADYDMLDHADAWLNSLSQPEGRNAWGTAHIEHARKVLTRLAALS